MSYSLLQLVLLCRAVVLVINKYSYIRIRRYLLFFRQKAGNKHKGNASHQRTVGETFGVSSVHCATRHETG